MSFGKRCGDTEAPCAVPSRSLTIPRPRLTPALSHFWISPGPALPRSDARETAPASPDQAPGEEIADVSVEHKVHLLARDPDRERVQRIMLRAPRGSPPHTQASDDPAAPNAAGSTSLDLDRARLASAASSRRMARRRSATARRPLAHDGLVSTGPSGKCYGPLAVPVVALVNCPVKLAVPWVVPLSNQFLNASLAVTAPVLEMVAFYVIDCTPGPRPAWGNSRMRTLALGLRGRRVIDRALAGDRRSLWLGRRGARRGADDDGTGRDDAGKQGEFASHCVLPRWTTCRRGRLYADSDTPRHDGPAAGGRIGRFPFGLERATRLLVQAAAARGAKRSSRRGDCNRRNRVTRVRLQHWI